MAEAVLAHADPVGPFLGEGHCTFCGTADVYIYPSPRAEMVKLGFDVAVCPTIETCPCFCPGCCGHQLDGHEFEYDRHSGRFECVNCGDGAPSDWGVYDVD